MRAGHCNNCELFDILYLVFIKFYIFSKLIMKKIILIFAILGLAIIIIGALFIFQKPVPLAPPEDNETYQCPQYIPPAASFYENCQKQGGTVTPGEKSDKGCQMPPQCVLSSKSSSKTTRPNIIFFIFLLYQKNLVIHSPFFIFILKTQVLLFHQWQTTKLLSVNFPVFII